MNSSLPLAPVLGVDIAKGTFDVALLLPNDQIYNKHFANTPSGFAGLLGWLEQRGMKRLHACMEATGTYGQALATFLHHAGHLVSMVNPKQVRAFAQSELARNKHDKLDAGVIARFCRAHRPRPWSPPRPEIVELQALVRRLEALQQMRQQELSRLDCGVQPSVRNSIDEHVQFLDGQITKTKEAIKEHVDQHPKLRANRDLLVSIKAIGQSTAALLLAEIPDIQQFAQARQVAAFIGLTPLNRSSGSSVRGKARLSKIGSARIRKALYMPALVAIKYNPVVRELAGRLANNGKAPMVIIGAVMRKLVHLAYGVLKTGRPFDPQHVYASS
jgi:transposase